MKRKQPSRLGDHGAVAIEFSLIFPVMLLMFAGIFGMGVVMIEDMQLTFVVQGAAKLEAAKAGTGVPWANAQLSPPASFTARQPGAGAMQRRTDHRTVAD